MNIWVVNLLAYAYNVATEFREKINVSVRMKWSEKKNPKQRKDQQTLNVGTVLPTVGCYAFSTSPNRPRT